MNSNPGFFVCVLVLINVVSGESSSKTEDLLNYCIDGLNHKERPGPQDALYDQCQPWRDRSCCTHNVSRAVHEINMYNFEWDHCTDVKPMSNACKRHFKQDLCFYECEPNLGPWVVKVDMKIRSERPFGVPLCASDCDAWYNDCKDEYTCVDNWTRDFIWRDGKNTCPLNHTCQPYSVIFKNSSKTFCETVWDDTWVYTSDDKPCMKIWFNGSEGNPNDKVAKLKVSEMYSTIQSAASSMQLNYLYIFFHSFSSSKF